MSAKSAGPTRRSPAARCRRQNASTSSGLQRPSAGSGCGFAPNMSVTPVFCCRALGGGLVSAPPQAPDRCRSLRPMHPRGAVQARSPAPSVRAWLLPRLLVPRRSRSGRRSRRASPVRSRPAVWAKPLGGAVENNSDERVQELKWSHVAPQIGRCEAGMAAYRRNRRACSTQTAIQLDEE